MSGLRARMTFYPCRKRSLKIESLLQHAGPLPYGGARLTRVSDTSRRTMMPTQPFSNSGSGRKHSAARYPNTFSSQCEHGHIDPTRCQKTLRTVWRKLTAAAGIKGFRFYYCRHHAITELAESQASDSTIMALAGHLCRRMLEHYSHVRRQGAKREALSVLSAKRLSKPATRGYDTKNGTEPVPPEQVPSYVIENMVGTRRLELLTFPAGRDALTDCFINQFLNRTMRFPGFDLPLAPARFGDCGELFAVNQQPGSATFCTMPALMLGQSSPHLRAEPM
jgi:hypothetical protein